MAPFFRYKNIHFFKRILTLCTIVWSTAAFCQPDSLQQEELQLFYIDNNAGNYTLSDLINPAFETNMQKTTGAINLGFETGDIWVKIQKDSTQDDLLLMLTNAHLDSIDVYFYSGKKLIRKEQSGDLLPFANRFTQNIVFNFLIPDGTSTIYLRVRTQGPMVAPVSVLSYADFASYISGNALFHFVYFGILIIAFITSMLMYTWLRDSISIYYSLYLFSVAFITALDFGYGFQYIWPSFPEVNKYNTIFYCLSFATLLFSEKLLNLKENSRVFYKIYQAMYVLFLLSVIAAIFVPYSLSIRGLFVTTMIIPLLSFASGIYLYARVKNEYMKFYLYGWSFFMISVILYVTSVAGFIPKGEIATNMLQIGSTIEIIFFNLAVLSRLGLLQKEKQQILAEQNIILERKVAERTVQLEEQNEVIETNNRLLQDQKMHLEKLVAERTAELFEINKDLKDKNQRLEHFADLTHHNLRGPVATLLGLCRIYNSNDPSDPFNKVVFENLCETVSNMDNIVRNLGQLLNTEEEIASLMVPVNLSAILGEVKTMLESEINRTGTVIEEDFSRLKEIKAVPAYLDNIFFQLLSNSIKFRRQNHVAHISVKSYREEDYACLEFRDNGLGIDLERFRDQLFRPFKRFHTHSDGRGLGLSIVKRQVEATGGEISLFSNPQNGLTILIKFKG